MSASSKSSPELVRHTLAELPKLPESTKKWRILLLVSAVNSLSQRVATYLSDLGFENTSIQLALTDEDVLGAVIAHQPHIVLCPFLTKKVPDQVWQNVITLIVHPGPPGDAGPAALDWAILGDLGTESDAAAALKPLTAGPLDRTLPVEQRQRTHWGITVLQADETMDGGPVWAYDQFPIPDVSKLTKSVLYQGEVSHAVLRSVTAAIGRIAAVVEKQCDPTRPGTWVDARVDPKWARECVSYGQPFLGGPLNERPQIKPGQRRPNLATHTAADVARIINCGDGQPGATLATAKSFLFAYDAHIHYNVDKLPPSLWVERGFASFEDIPAGTAIATRSGAVLFKTAPCTHGATCAYECGVAVWLTHGRVPKAANTGALKPKVPLTEALVSAGEGTKVDGVHEWPLVDFGEVTGTWQQVFVRTIEEAGALIQLVYWDYYNGAMSTTGCQQLVRGLQWATNPARGNVKMLVLMGGQYFSNGVALNIIEAAEHPGKETWDNINAIDDVVELVAGDSSPERSPFLQGTPSLTERGIVTVTVARGNAAAGGVAFAVASDIVIAANTVVFNPAYRGMGLHGSELHLWSYVERCGRDVATHMARDMLPISASYAQQLGLVDIVIGGRDSSRSEVDALAIDVVRTIARTSASEISQATSSWFTSAPWTRPGPGSLLQTLIHNKRTKFASSEHIPLLHYRQEELAQMLLDNFHPVRSERYHSRRIKFVRKVKADKTANRFVNHGSRRRTQDEEETAAFDDAPGHIRGEEWEWVGLPVPPSFATSAPLRIDFAAVVPPLPPYHSPKYPSSEDSASSVDEHEHPSAHRRPVSPASAASTSSVPPTPAEAEAPAVHTSKLDGKLSGPATKYQRPIVTNEGNTENPCLFNTASA